MFLSLLFFHCLSVCVSMYYVDLLILLILAALAHITGVLCVGWYNLPGHRSQEFQKLVWVVCALLLYLSLIAVGASVCGMDAQDDWL